MNLLAHVEENEFPRVFRCTESMSGWNYDGSGRDKPHMVSDLFIKEGLYWINFWEKITGQKREDTICSYEGCTNPHLVGGHIWLARHGGSPRKWCYIAPICQTCNNIRSEPDRELNSGSSLKKDTLVVRIRKPKDETEVIIPAMNNLRVDAEPPSPTPGGFTFGTPAPTFEKPPDAGTEVEILRRDLDDLRTDFEKVRRKLGKALATKSIGLITKEEEFEDIKRPNDFRDYNHHRQYPPSFKGMTSKDYRAWKGDFEAYHRQEQKNREIIREQEKSSGRPSLEEEQIAKDRLEAELQRVLKVEHEAEKLAKLRAYNEAEAEAKAQKKHFLETGEFISKVDENETREDAGNKKPVGRVEF